MRECELRDYGVLYVVAYTFMISCKLGRCIIVLIIQDLDQRYHPHGPSATGDVRSMSGGVIR